MNVVGITTPCVGAYCIRPLKKMQQYDGRTHRFAPTFCLVFFGTVTNHRHSLFYSAFGRRCNRHVILPAKQKTCRVCLPCRRQIKTHDVRRLKQAMPADDVRAWFGVFFA